MFLCKTPKTQFGVEFEDISLFELINYKEVKSYLRPMKGTKPIGAALHSFLANELS